MTKFKWQTNPALLTHGELTDNAGQLTGNNGTGNVVLGNPANSTPLATLAQTYAADSLDLSIAKTLGTGFIFLNGSSFDSMGVGVFEFEESNGAVYGLYGRTDGLNQQVYFSGAWTNKQALQYTTVPYVPPFLSGSVWQAACVMGSDLQGFTLALRDTSGASLTLRYIYVRHNGSLINTAGHTYVEITPVVTSFINSQTHVAGNVPNVIRVGAYFFILMADWQFGSLWVGGWNAQDGTYPFTNAALPSSAPSYTPTQFTITTTNLPGGDITTATAFPSVLGNNSPGGSGIFRLYNIGTGAVSTPTFMNAPNPIVAGWSTNVNSLLVGEVDGSGNPYIALGTIMAPGDSNSNQSAPQIVLSAAVQFTAGSAGAYTNAQLNFTTPSTPGADLYHMQPGVPYYLGYNGSYQPNETVQSNAGVPSTCVNKLPACAWYLGEGTHWGGSPVINWYYSGAVSVSSFGNGNIIRGVTQPASNGAGSLAAAQANKLAMIYPMFNVNRRVDFNPNTGATMTASFVQPSGQMVQNYFARIMSQDLLFAQAVNDVGQLVQTVSIMPSGSQITDASYNRFGTTVPGFRARTAEYLVSNLANPGTTLSNWGSCWPVGMANVNQPVNFQFPAITDSGPFAGNVNGAGCRLGNFTKSGSTYLAPPVVWNYAANMSAQLAALKATALSATTTAQSGFAGGGVLGIDVVPVLNSAGNGIAFALGIIHGRNASNNQIQFQTFLTPCGVTGSTINLTNTGSVTLLQYQATGTSGVPGNYTASDAIAGSLYVLYQAAGGNFYVAWSNPNTVGVAGDSLAFKQFYEFNTSNGVVSSSAQVSSQSRAMLGCSAQHHGLATFPIRDGDTVPEADCPISRYSTSSISSQNDLIAGWTAAFSNPSNMIPSDPLSRSYNLAEVLVLDSINNQFLLQLGAISGRLNHKEFTLPSTFLDLTAYSPGVYYLYVVDTGAGGIAIQFDSAQRTESSTNMYFGTFTRTTSGFTAEDSIQECIRFGTARLQVGNITAPIPGSCIRTGPYPMTST